MKNFRITFNSVNFIVANIISVILLLKLVHFTEGNDNNKVCNTVSCQSLAYLISKDIDITINPCDNFYGFVCNQYIQSTNIPSNKTRYDHFDWVDEKIYNQISILLDFGKLSMKPKLRAIIRNFYQSCLYSKIRLKAIAEILKELNGWPVVEHEWNGEKFDWVEMTYKLRDMGLPTNIFIDIGVYRHPVDHSKHVLYLDSPKRFLTDENKFEIYRTMAKDSFNMGANINTAPDEIELAWTLMLNLDNAKKIDSGASLDKQMTLKDLSKLHPKIPWTKYFMRILPSHMKIDENLIIIVGDSKYFVAVDDIIRKATTRAQANLIMWRVYSFLAQYIDDTQNLHNKKLQCIKVLGSYFSDKMNHMYISRYFEERTGKNVAKIIEDIKEQLKSTLMLNKWLDMYTKSRLLTKVQNITYDIGFTNTREPNNITNNLYKQLKIDSRYYMRNILNASLLKYELMFYKLQESADLEYFSEKLELPLTNAFYNYPTNEIGISPGLLQNVFFNNDVPHYLSYGAIGSIIGHEMTHSIDFKGLMYNERGEYDPDGFALIHRNYFQKRRCFYKQYSDYNTGCFQVQINGRSTADENINDLVGVKIAYQAYKQLIHNIGAEPKLPDLFFTPNQLFWISFARQYCSVESKDSLLWLLNHDHHSPREFRIIGPLSNLPEFAEDFQCSNTTFMNPINKCSIW